MVMAKLVPFQLKEKNFGNFGVCQLAENNLPAAGRFVLNSSQKVGTALVHSSLSPC
jgi:hypothetical protein